VAGLCPYRLGSLNAPQTSLLDLRVGEWGMKEEDKREGGEER